MFAWTQDLPINEEIYERIRKRLEGAALEGLLVHIAIRADDGHMRYVDVWESEAKCEAAMEAHIHPAVFGVLGELGITPLSEPPRTPITVVDVRLG
jgi:hypothetical protein